jgi:hypothetical protein
MQPELLLTKLVEKHGASKVLETLFYVLKDNTVFESDERRAAIGHLGDAWIWWQRADTKAMPHPQNAPEYQEYLAELERWGPPPDRDKFLCGGALNFGWLRRIMGNPILDFLRPKP